jgi:hypothetical protein
MPESFSEKHPMFHGPKLKAIPPMAPSSKSRASWGICIPSGEKWKQHVYKPHIYIYILAYISI